MADQLITGTTLIEDKRHEFGKVWSAIGKQFDFGNSSDTYEGDWGILISKNPAAGGMAICGVNLPDGSEVKSFIVYGSENDLTCNLKRHQLSTRSTEDTMASANMNTADETISNERINNHLYSYYIEVEEMAATDEIWGAKIVYD